MFVLYSIFFVIHLFEFMITDNEFEIIDISSVFLFQYNLVEWFKVNGVFQDVDIMKKMLLVIHSLR